MPTEQIDIHKYLRDAAPRNLVFAAEAYEQRFGIKFSSFTFFPGDSLHSLHQADGNLDAVPDNVVVGSRADSTILTEIDLLQQIANAGSSDSAKREQYFAALKRIYGKLPTNPGMWYSQRDTLCVGIEREGRILAKALGWLPPGHSEHPDMKRIPYRGGLVVGMANLPSIQRYAHCAIVDGAIASGATLISLIDHLRPGVSSFFVYAAHGSTEGVRAVAKYSRSIGATLNLTVGHVTTGLNRDFYAFDPSDKTKLVVGDLGDTIAGLDDAVGDS